MANVSRLHDPKKQFGQNNGGCLGVVARIVTGPGMEAAMEPALERWARQNY